MNRIEARGPGAVVTPTDFADLGAPDAVYQTLSRAVRAGRLRRVARGIYELPRPDADFGVAAPDLEAVIQAVADRSAARIVPTGAHAANVLGLSKQVPMRLTFLTDGPSRKVRLGRHEIVLRQASPRQLAPAGRMSSTVIQALRWIGRGNIDTALLAKIKRALSPEERGELLVDRKYAPAWVAEHLTAIADSSDEEIPE